MRRPVPSRPVRGQLRRNRRFPTTEQAEMGKSKRDWLAIFGNMASVITSILVAIVVAGPDNVRNIPQIPSVAYNTLSGAIERWRLDKKLTGKWTAKIPARPGAPAYKMILEMETNGGETGGMMTTPASVPWSNSQYADFNGKATGEFIELEFWGFVLGERRTFARSRIRILPEPCSSVCEDKPIDYDHLSMETYWQSSSVLPETIELVRE